MRAKMLIVLMGLVLAPTAAFAQEDIIELHITATWTASDFDVSSTLFGDDDKVFGVAPSEGSTSFTLIVDTSSVVSYQTGEFGVTHDWFGYSNATLAGTHTFGSASWETSDIITGLVGPNASTAALWTDTDISNAAPSLISFRMIGDWPGGNADLFVGPRSATTISTSFSMSEYYGGEAIQPASNAYTSSVAPPGAIQVEIDLKPGNARNVINPRSKGRAWLAILSNADFDALQVDPETVAIGSAGGSPDRYKVKASLYFFHYLNSFLYFIYIVLTLPCTFFHCFNSSLYFFTFF